MTIEELSRCDGREGRPAYVAVGKVIYDVSASPRWVDGQHEEAHQAGRDLTEEIKSAPHVRAVVERFPVVGRIEEPTAPPVKNRNFLLLAGIVAVGLILILLLLSK